MEDNDDRADLSYIGIPRFLNNTVQHLLYKKHNRKLLIVPVSRRGGMKRG